MTATQLYKLLTVEDLDNLPPPVWLLQDLLVAGSFAVLYGPPGIGKSFVALDFALSIAMNEVGIGEPRLSGPVVYIAAEGVSGISKRIKAWEKEFGRKAKDILCLPEAVNFFLGNDSAKLIKAVQENGTQPCLFVVDTLARCIEGGDENAAKDVGKIVANVTKLQHAFGCAVLVLHHGSKVSNNSKKCMERGSSALRGAADTMLSLTGKPDDLHLVCSKQKDSEPFKELILHLEVVQLDDGQTSCVLRPGQGGAATSNASASSDDEKAILQLLASAPAEGVRHGDLRKQYTLATGRSDSTFNRVWKELKDDPRITILASGTYVLSEVSGVNPVSPECHDTG